jgi:hypothetical protein
VSKWDAAVTGGEYDPADALRGLAAAKARHETAKEELAAARNAAGLDDERLTLPERWEGMTIAERRRALQAFGTTAIVRRRKGKESVTDRVFLSFEATQYRVAATGGDWEPDVVIDVVIEDAA